MVQRHGNKPVVYLDQNWLSEITKAYLGPETGIDRSYFLELSHVIQQGVARDRFVCPTSYSHLDESSLSSRLNTDLRSVDNTLSRGISFNSHVDISHEQLLQAASAFARINVSSENWWRIPFNRDPDTSASMQPCSAGGMEVFLTSAEMVDESRRVRNLVSGPLYHNYKEHRKRSNLSYPDEVKFNMVQLLRESYVGLDKGISLLGETPPGWEAFHWMTVHNQELRFEEIVQICRTRAVDGFKKFLSSEEFSATPFFSVRAKLMAADIVYNSCRAPEPSLLEDFTMVGTVLPYSNVFATENYIAELIRVTKLDRSFDCRVFTMRQKDDFLNLLSKI